MIIKENCRQVRWKVHCMGRCVYNVYIKCLWLMSLSLCEGHCKQSRFQQSEFFLLLTRSRPKYVEEIRSLMHGISAYNVYMAQSLKHYQCLWQNALNRLNWSCLVYHTSCNLTAYPASCYLTAQVAYLTASSWLKAHITYQQSVGILNVRQQVF